MPADVCLHLPIIGWATARARSERYWLPRLAALADDGTWARGKGWVIAQAAAALTYFWDTNPGMVRQILRALVEVLSS